MIVRISTGLAAIALLGAVGCAGAGSSTIRDESDRRLARPNVTLVFDFRVSPADVALDGSPGKALARAAGDESDRQRQEQIARAAASALSEKIMVELRERGINAQHARSLPPPGRNALLVRGDFVEISEGTRLSRMVVGFGMGASGVKTRVKVYSNDAAGMTAVEEFETKAHGSRSPGMAVPLVGGSAMGNVATSAIISGSTNVLREALGSVEKDVNNTAEEIAERVGQLYARQGWL